MSEREVELPPELGFAALCVLAVAAAIAAVTCAVIGTNRQEAEKAAARAEAERLQTIQRLAAQSDRTTGGPAPRADPTPTPPTGTTGAELLEIAKCLGSASAVGLIAGIGGLLAAADSRSRIRTLQEDLSTARSTVQRLNADAPVREAGKHALERLPQAQAELKAARADAVRLTAQLDAAEVAGRMSRQAASRIPTLEADLATARRTAAEQTARQSDPTRKEALVRLLEERAAAREDALTDGTDEAVRAARLAAIDDDLGPKIETAYAAL